MRTPEVEIRHGDSLYVDGRFRGMVRPGYKYKVAKTDKKTGVMLVIETDDEDSRIAGSFWLDIEDV
jgi:hypothetical protein